MEMCQPTESHIKVKPHFSHLYSPTLTFSTLKLPSYLHHQPTFDGFISFILTHSFTLAFSFVQSGKAGKIKNLLLAVLSLLGNIVLTSRLLKTTS
jgi:hypothetical protein